MDFDIGFCRCWFFKNLEEVKKVIHAEAWVAQAVCVEA
jgi:hypothetical protein